MIFADVAKTLTDHSPGDKAKVFVKYDLTCPVELRRLGECSHFILIDVLES